MLIEEAGAGDSEPEPSSEEESIQFDFSSTDDHIVREQD
jgi:hypothetical protein